MSHWIALLPPPPVATPQPGDTEASASGASSPCPAAEAIGAEHLAWWALQFTPRVALLEGAVVMELQASERLFGGRAALVARIATEAMHWRVAAWARGHTALAALALARAAEGETASAPLAASGAAGDAHGAQLDHLPLSALSAVAAHQPTLSRLGCRTLGQVRALPRGGLSRRFGAPLLQALDQAYGELPLALDWVSLPPRFEARLELPGRVDTAPGLVFAAQRLLQPLCAWLAGMQSGVLAFTLGWWHDGRRHDGSRTGQHTIRLASPSRDIDRLGRLLHEHLQRLTLESPVTDLKLHADEVQRLAPDSLQLFQDPGAVGPHGLSAQPDALLTTAAQRAQRDALLALLDRLSVRLGPTRVQQGHVVPDHRLEHAQHWAPALTQAGATPAITSASAPASAAPRHLIADLPHPCWVLAQPLPLAMAREPGGLRERPLYQGPLHLLAGPHRVEAGWWDDACAHPAVARDYYLASSAHAGLLWVYKTRPVQLEAAHATHTDSPWYLHGLFA
ncbi:MAG: hypothetical protein RI907_1357 [Pseudomonadota bacterium]|jgi:protein ImuB